jgi:uncharacterized protein
MIFDDFNQQQIIFIVLIFVWTGFVRTGLGFGGAALGLPLLLFLDPRPIIWLPMIGWHLLFFSALTIGQKWRDVDWNYLRHTLMYIIPSALVGVFGLINLPNQWLLNFVYSVTLFYAITWILGFVIRSQRNWVDKALLLTGGYIAGTSLTGAPLIVAVFMRHVNKLKLRNTLFVLWFLLVTLKMSAFSFLSVNMQILPALSLIAPAAIGHFMGIKTHEKILQNDILFKKIMGIILCFVSLLGIISINNLF